ncbi:MAG: hypothetical protein H7X94_10490 [Vallitaleaceae bacterium]|nr:hypothetical protein [Vallitaleaceae bacterium]
MMLKLTKDEFIEELRAEVAGYDEISEANEDDFIGRIEKYIEAEKGKNKRISIETNSIMIQLEDETDLFEIVDQYLVAILDEEVDRYWQNWKL